VQRLRGRAVKKNPKRRVRKEIWTGVDSEKSGGDRGIHMLEGGTLTKSYLEPLAGGQYTKEAPQRIEIHQRRRLTTLKKLLTLTQHA